MDYEAKRKLKQIIFTVILLMIFLYLALYIGAFIVDVYKENRNATEEISSNIVECTTYVYGIENVKLNKDKLRFVIQNTIGEGFNTIEVEVDGREFEVELDDISVPQLVEINNVDATSGFTVYPKGCKDNKKEFGSND